MENQLFRKTSMERISSPEQLHDYMRVTSPKLWMLLGAIVALLVGFIVYASTATMESTVSVQAVLLTEEYEGTEITTVSIALPASDSDLVRPGMTVRVAGKEGAIQFVLQDDEGVIAMVDMKEDVLHVPDGTYDAEIVTESTTPISFLLN